MKPPVTTVAAFAPLRDNIIARLLMTGYPETEAVAITDAAIYAHVKAINHRMELLGKMVDKVTPGAPRSETLMIFLALEGESLRRNTQMLTGDTGEDGQ